MTSLARIIHWSPGRCRIRLADMRGDQAYFESLCAQLRIALPNVGVTFNALTGSVLLTGDVPETGRLAALAGSQGLFELETNDEPVALPFRLPDLSPDLSGEEVRRLLTIAFVTLAAVQALRGQIMVPATSFLMYALATSAFSPDSA